MALTAALEKGADVVEELMLIARLTVAENMQNKRACEFGMVFCEKRVERI